MKKLTIYFSAALILLAMGAGCKGKKVEISPELASNDEQLFQLGEEFIKKDPEKGRLYLRQVIDSFPKSFYAQRAKLLIADSYFEKGDEGNMIIAASEYREFISLFPYSPSAPYAQTRIAETYFRKALKPGRDQTKTRQALTEYQKVLNTYPLSEEAEASREKIRECEERLAEHTLSIGEHYYKVHAYKASTARLIEILTEYPSYSKMDKVYFLLGDSYFLWTQTDKAVPYFTKLITDYPQSKYSKKATERMEELEKVKK